MLLIHGLLLLPLPIVFSGRRRRFLSCFTKTNAVINVLPSFAIIPLRSRDLAALLKLTNGCHVGSLGAVSLPRGAVVCGL